MYKEHYSRFLKANSNKLHFASHSHHYWPDVTREAHIQYWDDCCQFVDHKWEHFYSNALPQAQNLIKEVLNISSANSLVFAPNTHELVFRLLSSLDWQKKDLKILTTDSEFYSFDRQINRLSESSQWQVTKVPTEPFDSFETRFCEEAHKQKYDLIFVSQVFFNSGFAVDLNKLVPALPPTLVAIDGYHAFMALPTDLRPFQDKIFYLAGGYKYAQGGEGACFMHVPPQTRHRPLYTGWFAEIANLSSVGTDTPYPQDAQQYAGSTLDFSGVYRLRAALELFKKIQLSIESIHQFIKKHQLYLIERLPTKGPFSPPHLLWNEERNGHFLTFKISSAQETQNLVTALKKAGVEVDSRKDRIRIGFGLYHDQADLDRLLKVICSL